MRFWFLLFSYLITSLLAGITHAAELVTLSQENYAEFAPRGKEARAFIGDYVLRNDKIVVAVADPTLLSGRSAYRWAIPNVSGAVVDLTLRDKPNDLLTAFYPAPLRYKPDAPNTQDELVDERLAATQPGREPKTGKSVTLLVPPYELESGKMLDELAKLPVHLRGAAKPYVEVRYTLADGWNYLLVETTYINPTDKAFSPNVNPRLRIYGTTQYGLMFDDRLAWVYDKWFNQAYGVVGDGHSFEMKRDGNGDCFLNHKSADGKPVVVPAKGKATVTRRLIVGDNLAQVTRIAGEVLEFKLRQVKLTVGAGTGFRPGVHVVAMMNDKTVAAGRTVALGVLNMDLPPGDAVIHVEVPGKQAIQLPIRGDGPIELKCDYPILDMLTGKITDDAGNPIAARIRLLGINGTATPDIVPATAGGNQVRNVIFTVDGSVSADLGSAKGRYEVLITHGPEFDPVTRTINLDPERPDVLNCKLHRSVQTPGWIAADMHNHSAVSGRLDQFFVYPYSKDPTADVDSNADPRGLVLNLLTEGIDFAPTSEHNFVTSFSPILKELNAEHLLATTPGIGLTAGRRHTTTHQNVFPVTWKPGGQDGGVLQRPEHIGQLEWLQRIDNGSEILVQIVGTRGDPCGISRGMDALDVIDLEPIIEGKPINGRDNRILNWLEHLSSGYRITGVVNSNSTDNYNGAGRLRNYIQSPTDDPAKINPMDIVRAVKRGRVVMTTGPFMSVTMTPGGNVKWDAIEVLPGSSVRFPEEKIKLHVRVQGNSATTIDRVQVLINGKPDSELNITRKNAPAKFAEGPVQFDQVLPLSIADDSYVIIVASGTGMDERSDKPDAMRTHVVVSNPIWIDAGAEGYQPRSPLDDMVEASLQFVEPPVAKAGAEPGRVRLVLKNRGNQAAEDVVSLKIVPENAGRIIGPVEQYYKLPFAGAEGAVEWRFEFAEEYLKQNFPLPQNYNLTNRFGVRVERSAKLPGRRGAAHWMHVDHHIGSVVPTASPDEAVSALADEVEYPIGRGGTKLGNVRMAVAGRYLAVLADIMDKDIKRQPVVWEGSCLELFACMPGRHPKNTKPGGYYDIGQVYLTPAVGQQPAAGFHRKGEQIVAAPDIKLTSTPVAGGFQLKALVPLSLLLVDVDDVVRMIYLDSSGFTDVSLVGLEARPGRFMFDARANGQVKEGGPRARATIFGSVAPHVDSSSFGTMRAEGKVIARLEVTKPLSPSPDGPPGHVKLHLRNQSKSIASDKATLTLDPPDAARVIGDPSVTYSLKPGEQITREFDIAIQAGASVNGVGLLVPRSPKGEIIATPSPRIGVEGRPIARIAALTDPAKVKDALASQPASRIKIKDQSVATVRFALAGDRLALHVTAVEKEVVQDVTRPWKGSSFEVFGAAAAGEAIGQVFLLPAAKDAPARGMRSLQGKAVAVDDIHLVTSKMADGYEVLALIPLSHLAIKADASEMLLEFQLTNLGPESKRVSGTVFGSTLTYRDNAMYGRFRVQGKP